MSTITQNVGEDLEPLVKSFERSLRSTNEAPKTIRSYTGTVRGFREFLMENGMPTDVRRLTREHVETYIVAQVERYRPKTARACPGSG